MIQKFKKSQKIISVLPGMSPVETIKKNDQKKAAGLYCGSAITLSQSGFGRHQDSS